MKKFCLTLMLICISNYFIYSQVPYYYYSIPSGTNNNLNSINFVNSYYLIVGINGTALKSTNNGLSWVSISLNTSNSLKYILENNEYFVGHFIFGYNGTILKGINNGSNWAIENSGVTNNLYSGASTYCYNPYFSERLIAVGSNGIILMKKIYPDSTGWNQISSGITNDLKSIYLIGNEGWIAGSSGKILYTNNGGDNWYSRSSGISSDLNSVYFKSVDKGFAIGNNGVILKTTTGGYLWSQQTSNTTKNLNKIFSFKSSDTSNLCIIGNNVLLTSSNGGDSWTIDSNSPAVNLYSGYYRSATEDLIVVGDSGKVFRRCPDTVYHPNINVQLRANKINSYFIKTGVFNQNKEGSSNRAGFEWPKDSGKCAIFSSGLTIAAIVSSEVRMAACSYSGEYKPGYCTNGVFHTNLYFKIYKVKKSDNAQTNWDWANWGQMVSYGAPYIDVNHNGIYESAIDTPGVKNANETLFLCMTDADPASHSSSEGFGGGTAPLGAEVHMTAWAYDLPALQNVQFINYEIINKSTNTWNAVQMGLVCDPDLGDGNDDYIGCDTSLNLGYCYNADNYDNDYGANPPAVGMTLLRSPLNRNVTPNVRLKMTSFDFFTNNISNPPTCEHDPETPSEAYNYLSGYKRDMSTWLDLTQSPPKQTKMCYPGDPETSIGWMESSGCMQNCGLDTIGPIVTPCVSGDRRYIISSGSNNFGIVPGDTQKIAIAQLIARGSNNLNSVTLLKNLTSQVISFYETNFPIGIKQISGTVPQNYKLEQNYPNPFNPTTNIKYQIPKNSFVTLKIYDILGKEVETLINEFQQAGVYETQFTNSSNNNLASGIYFYKLVAGDYTAVKRMVLVK